MDKTQKNVYFVCLCAQFLLIFFGSSYRFVMHNFLLALLPDHSLGFLIVEDSEKNRKTG